LNEIGTSVRTNGRLARETPENSGNRERERERERDMRLEMVDSDGTGDLCGLYLKPRGNVSLLKFIFSPGRDIARRISFVPRDADKELEG